MMPTFPSNSPIPADTSLSLADHTTFPIQDSMSSPSIDSNNSISDTTLDSVASIPLSHSVPLSDIVPSSNSPAVHIRKSTRPSNPPKGYAELRLCRVGSNALQFLVGKLSKSSLIFLVPKRITPWHPNHAGVLGPVFIIASLIALFCLLKRRVKQGKYDPEQAYFHSTISFRKACTTRLFTYHELDQATKGFEGAQKLVDSSNGTIYAGVLEDGSHVAVHKLQCDNERDLLQVLSQIEVLSAVQHRNMARLLGCCIDSGYTPLVVYEYPANGTLEEHLHQSREHNIGLDWYKRLHIAAETASVLAFLQYEISPPIFHHYLKSGCIFLDQDFSVKIAGFGLLSLSLRNEADLYNSYDGSRLHKNDVYDLGMLLLEIIAGSNHLDMPTVALQKLRCGKLEEIVDPLLYYHEQPPFRREQIEIVGDLATRCMLFGGDGKLGMIDAARELVHITKESIDGGSKRVPALEETFSNSSLLQMISMSPDSVYVH
ncbi:probably inactive receptor-like protein kinase At2g46850 [Fagus crenata]